MAVEEDHGHGVGQEPVRTVARENNAASREGDAKATANVTFGTVGRWRGDDGLPDLKGAGFKNDVMDRWGHGHIGVPIALIASIALVYDISAPGYV